MKKLKFKKMTAENAKDLLGKIDNEGGNEYFWCSYTSPEDAVEDYNISEPLYKAAKAYAEAHKILESELTKIEKKFPTEDYEEESDCL